MVKIGEAATTNFTVDRDSNSQSTALEASTPLFTPPTWTGSIDVSNSSHRNEVLFTLQNKMCPWKSESIYHEKRTGMYDKEQFLKGEGNSCSTSCTCRVTIVSNTVISIKRVQE